MSGLNYGSKYCLSRSERPLNSSGNPKKKVYKFDSNEKLLKVYESLRQCSEQEKINRTTLINKIRSREMYNNNYYSYYESIFPTIQLF